MAYREFQPRPELSELVACTWERRVPAGSPPSATRVLPDGCVDLLWRDGSLLVAGPDSGPMLSPLPAGSTIVGVRLRPGAAGAVLGMPASELRDDRVPLGELWRDDLAELLGEADEPRSQRRLLENALLARLADGGESDPLVLAAARGLGRPGSRVAALGERVGLSERQLLRRFQAAVGYGPKTLDRILRFQRFVSVAAAGDDLAGARDLARVAADLGYADQAHLTRECVRLSGVTPTALRAERAGLEVA